MTLRRATVLFVTSSLFVLLASLTGSAASATYQYTCPSETDTQAAIERCKEQGMDYVIDYDAYQCTYVKCIAPPPPPPPTAECTKEECDPVSSLLPYKQCPDGSWEGPTECKRYSDGKCGWIFHTCLEPSCPTPASLEEAASKCKAGGMEYEYYEDGRCRQVRCRRPFEDCTCPMVYEPVCGVDGRTYGNDCKARCIGVEIGQKGECPRAGCPSREALAMEIGRCESMRMDFFFVTENDCPYVKCRERKFHCPPEEEIKRMREECEQWGGKAEIDASDECPLLRCIRPVEKSKRCEELEALIHKLSEADAFEGPDYQQAKAEYMAQCLHPERNPCPRMDAVVGTTPTAADDTLYARFCPSGRPIHPDPQAFCPKMRQVLEEGGEYTAQEKELYYKICFQESRHVPEGSDCKNMRARLLKLLKSGQTDTEEYAKLKREFTERCEEMHIVPPAGFEEEVIAAEQCDEFGNPFPDTIPCSDAEDEALEGLAAQELYRRGVIGGFPDGEFKGDRPVNRAEAAKFLLLACNLPTDAPFSGRLRDVLANQWYTPFVEAAADRGIISGYPDGTFRPANTVNRAEFLKMLSLACDLPLDQPHSYLDVSSDDWFNQYAGSAAAYDLYLDDDDGELKPGNLQTRRETAVAIYQYLKNR